MHFEGDERALLEYQVDLRVYVDGHGIVGEGNRALATCLWSCLCCKMFLLPQMLLEATATVSPESLCEV